VITDHERLATLGLEISEEPLLARGRVVRHDPNLLAEAVYRAYCRWKSPGANAEEEGQPEHERS
jgi:hypothetical protein